MIELHFWPTPNGKKVSIALEEMGLPYRLVAVNIGAGDQFKPEFLKLSPNGRMPAIVDPDGPGGQPISIFESGAILQYLGRKSGRFYPQDERSKIDVDQWLFWQVGGLGPMAGQANHFRNYAPSLAPDSRMTAYGAHRYTNEVHRLYGVIERARRPGLSRRRLFDRGHGQLALGRLRPADGGRDRGVSPSQGLVRPCRRPAGGGEGQPGGGRAAPRHLGRQER